MVKLRRRKRTAEEIQAIQVLLHAMGYLQMRGCTVSVWDNLYTHCDALNILKDAARKLGW